MYITSGISRKDAKYHKRNTLNVTNVIENVLNVT